MLIRTADEIDVQSLFIAIHLQAKSDQSVLESKLYKQKLPVICIKQERERELSVGYVNAIESLY